MNRRSDEIQICSSLALSEIEIELNKNIDSLILCESRTVR
jgi:hypothetical protein